MKILLLIFLTTGSLITHADSTPFTLEIRTDEPRQVIRGFGASGAWPDDEYLEYSGEERRRFTDFLFHPKRGIGLHIYRTRVYPNARGRMKPKPFDWEDDNVVAIGRFCREIDERYDLTLMASPWTPPAWMKTNRSRKGGELDPKYYPDYAAYLVEFLSGMRERFGASFDVLSIQNEADSAKKWDSCVWNAEQFTIFTRDHLLPAMKLAGLEDIRLALNEETTWKDDTINAVLKDPVLAEQVDISAAPQYWGGHKRERIRPFEKARELGLDLWMTEFYYGNYLLRGRRHDEDGAAETKTPATFTALDRTLALARIQHDTLTRAEVNAWLFWWLFTTKSKDVQALVNAHQEFGNVDGPLTGYTIRKWAYGLGQYAKFVRPGSVRHRVHSPGAPGGVMVSAYRRPDNRWALVAINLTPDAAAFSLKGVQAESWSAHRTSKNENLSPLPPDSGTWVLAPRSITSLLSSPTP